MKPFSQSCLNNRDPILEILKRVFVRCHQILEIGSGTGQHAVYFAEHLPHLRWQTSDLVENHAGIKQWLQECPQQNMPPPLELDVTQPPWPVTAVDGIFSANTAHIMPWEAVEKMFAGIPAVLQSQGVLALYGPFNYGGEYTSDSNQRFDRWLKSQAPYRAIRDFEKVNALAERAGLSLLEDNAMPAHNRLLVWHRA